MSKSVTSYLLATLLVSSFSVELPLIIPATASDMKVMTAQPSRRESAHAVGLQAYLWGHPLRYHSQSTPKSVEC